MDEVLAINPPEVEIGSLLWRMKFAYDNPHREGILIEAFVEIERLRAESDYYKRIAEEAVSNLEQAVKLLQAFQAAVHD